MWWINFHLAFSKSTLTFHLASEIPPESLLLPFGSLRRFKFTPLLPLCSLHHSRPDGADRGLFSALCHAGLVHALPSSLHALFTFQPAHLLRLSSYVIPLEKPSLRPPGRVSYNSFSCSPGLYREERTWSQRDGFKSQLHSP